MPQITPQATETRSLIQALNTFIEIFTDSERGFAAAAADVRDPTLKVLFLQTAKERSEFVIALQESIQKMGAFAENQGTAGGAVRRGWMGLRLALEGRRDRLIIDEWVRGENTALQGYERVLAKTELETMPQDVRAMVQTQYSALQAGLAEARRHLDSVH